MQGFQGNEDSARFVDLIRPLSRQHSHENRKEEKKCPPHKGHHRKINNSADDGKINQRCHNLLSLQKAVQTNREDLDAGEILDIFIDLTCAYVVFSSSGHEESKTMGVGSVIYIMSLTQSLTLDANNPPSCASSVLLPAPVLPTSKRAVGPSVSRRFSDIGEANSKVPSRVRSAVGCLLSGNIRAGAWRG